MGTPILEPTSDRLYADLESNPSLETFLALADFYESEGDPAAAECLRWAADTHKWPFRYSEDDDSLREHHGSWNEGWYWWADDKFLEDDVDDELLEDEGAARWGLPEACRLARTLWKQLAHGFPYDPLCFKEYPTVRKAFEALIAAWKVKRPRR